MYKSIMNWLWYADKGPWCYKIIKVKGWNSFLIKNNCGSISIHSIAFNYWPNWKYMLKRVFSLGVIK